MRYEAAAGPVPILIEKLWIGTARDSDHGQTEQSLDGNELTHVVPFDAMADPLKEVTRDESGDAVPWFDEQ